MNKEIIYIEQNDDIADLISKIKGSDGKLIVLIPPKETNALHSSVNMKLILKTIREAEKSLVVVTEDPALVRFAAELKIPVASNLKTRPMVPQDESKDIKEIIADDFTSEPESSSKMFDEINEENEETKESEKAKEEKTKEEPKKEKKNKLLSKIPNFEEHKKWFIFGGAGAVTLVLFLIWALLIAPAVKIRVHITTIPSGFSETISFTKKESEEDSEAGKFYLVEEKYEKESEVTFEATGERDDGNKASGTITVSAYLAPDETLKIPTTATFTYDSLVYNVSEAASLSYDADNCENSDTDSLIRYGCLRSAQVKIAASAAGVKYNIDAHEKGWTTSFSGITIKGSSAISGGTSKIVKFVQQSDIDKAKEKLSTTSESTGKTKLFEQISDTMIKIDSSYKMTSEKPVSKPALNEAVKDGEKPKLTVKTIFTIYTIDSVRVKEFISAKAKITNDRKVYSLGEPFIERFIETDDGFTAKLKTTYTVGPNVTEDSVREKVYGKKIGEARSALGSINGVKTEIEQSVFWVNLIPTDPNRVSVEIIDTSE